MSITDSVASARTFFANFSVPCMYIALVSLGAGFGAGLWAMNHWNKGDLQEARADKLQAEKACSDFKSSVATEAATAATNNATQLSTLLGQVNTLAGVIDGITAKLGPKIDATNNTLRSLTNAPQFSCLYLPYPVAGLRALEQQAGNAAASEGDGH